MTKRDARIVVWSRLYRLLADRDEYMHPDLEARVQATAPRRAPSLSGIDAQAIEDMTEIDRLCGGAVRKLRKTASEPVIDLLGWLNADRLAAVALALPEARRRRVLRDPVWARALASITEEAIQEVETLIADAEASERKVNELVRVVGIDPEALTEGARRYLLGLPHDLPPEQVEGLEAVAR
jgi:hypothetical protein